MSRFRYRNVAAGTYAVMGGVNRNPVYYPGSGFGRRLRSESMYDTVSLPGTRAVNSCVHDKVEASIISGQIDYLTSGGVLVPYVITQLAITDERPMADHYNTRPWSNLVSDLSRQVDGKLQTKSLLPVTLLELSKTYQMVKNPFGLLKSDWRSRAGELTASKLARKGANLWLEGRYGWGAGYYDMKQFAASARKLHRSITNSGLPTEGRSFSYTARHTETFAVPSPSMSDVDWSVWTGSCSWWNDNDGIVRIVPTAYRAESYVTARSDDPVVPSYNAVQRFCQAYGLTIDHLLPILWEIVPYSFVVDWFIDCQGIMAYLDYKKLESERLYHICHTVKTVQTFDAEFTPGLPWDSPYSYESYYPRALKGRGGVKVHYDRRAFLPVSESFLKGDLLSMTQLVSGGALLLQRLIH